MQAMVVKIMDRISGWKLTRTTMMLMWRTDLSMSLRMERSTSANGKAKIGTDAVFRSGRTGPGMRAIGALTKRMDRVLSGT